MGCYSIIFAEKSVKKCTNFLEWSHGNKQTKKKQVLKAYYDSWIESVWMGLILMNQIIAKKKMCIF